jgi:rubredoxin
MKYGMNRIGHYEKEKCSNCEWEGYRSELEKDFTFDDDGEDIVDEHWVCPHCKLIIIE